MYVFLDIFSKLGVAKSHDDLFKLFYNSLVPVGVGPKVPACQDILKVYGKQMAPNQEVSYGIGSSDQTGHGKVN